MMKVLYHTWYHREGSRTPLFSRLMYVRVTDACELDVDDHVVITTRSSSERERRELAACDMRSVSHTLSWFVESTHIGNSFDEWFQNLSLVSLNLSPNYLVTFIETTNR